ncbi:MAG: hypothetical protein IKA76_00600 [Clostridia bacterium]|nr:hypothetical protein [Clostridia bacterium]
MEYALMAVSVLFASLNSIILRIFKNRTVKTPGDSFFFNGGLSLVWMMIMTVWFFASGDRSISAGALIFGAIYGGILCLFLFFKNESIASGPVSLTSLIGNCAFIIATFFGVIYASEGISIFQLIGMAVILLSLFLCINPKKSAVKLTAKWFLYCFGFFVAGGLIGILYKIFGKSDAASEVNGMMLTASVVSAVCFFLFGVIVNRVKGQGSPKIRRGSLLFILLCGITGCIYIRLNVSLSALIPSAVFFPVANGGIVVATTVAGALWFKEKLNRTQLLGILFGLLGIIITGCGEFLWGLVC